MRLAVCYQNVDPARGGAETYVADLCRSLVAAGHQVDLLAERWRADAIAAGVECIKIDAPGATRVGRAWGYASRCAQRLKDTTGRYDCTVGLIGTWGTDVLVPQGGVKSASLDCNARRFRNPVARAFYRVSKRLNVGWHVARAIERRQYGPGGATRIVAVSRMVRGHLQKYHRVDSDRIDVIPNAIDAARMQGGRVEDRARLRATLGVADDTAVALFAAHNFRLKGLFPLLRALARRRELVPEGRALRLAVCGGGDAEPFRRLAKRLDITEHVHFLGFQKDVGAIFRAADFFVLPTYYDPCSLVVFEALTCGLPVITTRQNGAG